jgi:hypothetical protein
MAILWLFGTFPPPPVLVHMLYREKSGNPALHTYIFANAKIRDKAAAVVCTTLKFSD